MNTPKPHHDPLQSTFADRIKLLIQRVGSATEIARMCGFSEGVVRSWRDGQTDPSRARCVTMARTLGISLVWLVAGEGALQVDPSTVGGNAQHSSENSMHRTRSRMSHVQPPQLAVDQVALDSPTVDPRRLNTAMQILQSELELASSPMTLAENTDMLSQLYMILGHDGSSVDANAMLKFNRQLSERIRQSQVA